MAEMEYSEPILSCLPMVSYLAERFSRRFAYIGFEQFQSAGNLGLVQSAMKYDAAKGTKFSTYVWRGIMNAMRELIRSEARHSQTVVVNDFSRCPDPIDDIDSLVISDCVGYLTERMTPQEREFLQMRFFQGCSQKKIATVWSVSPQRVSQYEKALLQKLKTIILQCEKERN